MTGLPEHGICPAPEPAAVEEWVGRFEDAWTPTSRPEIGAFLPAETALRQHVLGELIFIDLENRIKAGEPARVEEYERWFAELAEPDTVVAELAVTEYRLRLRKEPELDLRAFLSRFPAQAARIEPLLDPDHSPSGAPTRRETPVLEPAEDTPVRAEESHAPPGDGTLDPVGAQDGNPRNSPGREPIPELPGYHVVELLGKGGMGIVYRAEDLKLGRHVALKVMRPETASDPMARERFLREARAMAAVEHEHVVVVHHVGQQDEIPYIVMPLLRGETLDSRIRREGPVPPDEVRRIGVEAAEGLAAAHRRGLIHRDIKPSNIWLEGEEGRVKLLDFGLARDISLTDSSLTPVHAILGTPSYMSPEQAAGKPVDVRSDLFSLGATLYCAATGKAPFDGDSFLERLFSVRTQEPVPPHQKQTSIPLELSQLIMRLLGKEPHTRPVNAEEVRERLLELPKHPVRGESDTRYNTPRTDANSATSGSRGRLSGWLFFAPVVCLLIVAGLTPWLLKPGPDAIPSHATTGDLPSHRVEGWLDIYILKQEQGRLAERPRLLEEPGVLPIRAGDAAQVDIALTNGPAFIYVVMLEAGGGVAPCYPWEEFDWNRRGREEPRKRYHFPESQEYKLKFQPGDSGIECYLLMARSTRLPVGADEELAKAFGRIWKKQDVVEVQPLRMWLRNGNIVEDEPHRGKLVPERVLPAESDPVERVQALMRGPLAERFSLTRAVLYSFRGE